MKWTKWDSDLLLPGVQIGWSLREDNGRVIGDLRYLNRSQSKIRESHWSTVLPLPGCFWFHEEIPLTEPSIKNLPVESVETVKRYVESLHRLRSTGWNGMARRP